MSSVICQRCNFSACCCYAESPRILAVHDLPLSQAVELQSLLEHENEGDEDEEGEDAAAAAATIEDAEAGKPRRVVLVTSVPVSASV